MNIPCIYQHPLFGKCYITNKGSDKMPGAFSVYIVDEYCGIMDAMPFIDKEFFFSPTRKPKFKKPLQLKIFKQ